MPESDASFTGTIPATYDRYLGPLLFAPYAADLARRAKGLGAERLIEIAAGTGVATRTLALALPDAHIEATDLNDAMVQTGSRLLATSKVRWSVADAMALPFPDAAFDLAVCQFGVMFFPDPLRCFREARRVLQPDGSFLFNVWDDLRSNDVARIVFETGVELFADDPPAFLARTPYGHGDVARLENELREAGFTQISYETVEHASGRVSSNDAARGFCEGTPMRNEILERDPDQLPHVVRFATQRLREAFGDTVGGKMRAFVFRAS